MSNSENSKEAPKRENMFVNLVCNIILPMALLTKGSKYLPDLNPTYILLFALCFPVGYLIYDLKQRKNWNVFSIIGFVSIMLTGTIGLFKLSPQVFAIKEAALPSFFGLYMLLSLKTSKPLIKEIFLNPSLVDTVKINEQLEARNKHTEFKALIAKVTWIMGASSLLSTVLNYVITVMVVKTDPNIDQAAFNQELGLQTGITWAVIGVLSLPFGGYALWTLCKGIQNLTELTMDEIFLEPPSKEKLKEENAES